MRTNYGGPDRFRKMVAGLNSRRFFAAPMRFHFQLGLGVDVSVAGGLRFWRHFFDRGMQLSRNLPIDSRHGRPFSVVQASQQPLRDRLSSRIASFLKSPIVTRRALSHASPIGGLAASPDHHAQAGVREADSFYR